MRLKKSNLYRYSMVVIIFLIAIAMPAASINEVKASNFNEAKIESNKIIYLTFDDGPSVLTDEVLDILKENDIKATFFLIGNQIADQQLAVKRIADEGHSIGLHTFTHNFKKIYSSKESFINEMIQCQNEIYGVTNIKPTITRFPGGSYKRLSKDFLAMLHGYNFKVYDWNLCLSDGINFTTPANKLYLEATSRVDNESPIILLMHCDYMHKNTCKALPEIIKYYKDQGYEFKVLSEDTPEHIFPVH